jgi:hypothetical protein
VNRDGILRELVFKSWWSEDTEREDSGNNESAGGLLQKRYLTIKFDIYAQTFEVLKLFYDTSATALIINSIITYDFY